MNLADRHHSNYHHTYLLVVGMYGVSLDPSQFTVWTYQFSDFGSNEGLANGVYLTDVGRGIDHVDLLKSDRYRLLEIYYKYKIITNNNAGYNK